MGDKKIFGGGNAPCCTATAFKIIVLLFVIVVIRLTSNREDGKALHVVQVLQSKVLDLATPSQIQRPHAVHCGQESDASVSDAHTPVSKNIKNNPWFIKCNEAKTIVCQLPQTDLFVPTQNIFYISFGLFKAKIVRIFHNKVIHNSLTF